MYEVPRWISLGTNNESEVSMKLLVLLLLFAGSAFSQPTPAKVLNWSQDTANLAKVYSDSIKGVNAALSGNLNVSGNLDAYGTTSFHTSVYIPNGLGGGGLTSDTNAFRTAVVTGRLYATAGSFADSLFVGTSEKVGGNLSISGAFKDVFNYCSAIISGNTTTFSNTNSNPGSISDMIASLTLDGGSSVPAVTLHSGTGGDMQITSDNTMNISAGAPITTTSLAVTGNVSISSMLNIAKTMTTISGDVTWTSGTTPWLTSSIFVSTATSGHTVTLSGGTSGDILIVTNASATNSFVVGGLVNSSTVTINVSKTMMFIKQGTVWSALSV